MVPDIHLRTFSNIEGKMARILIIDDDEIFTEIVTEVLEQNEHMVSSVHDGNAAVPAVLNALPDLLILDYTLPGRSGLEVLSDLRRLPEMASVPVIMLTGSSDSSLTVRAALTGADDYIIKPFDPDDLLRRTEAMLKGGALPRQVVN
jgi:DNA-binding response OmpR family regulator